MAKQPSLPTITGTYLSATQIDDAFREIEDAFTNTLSRDGSTPNTMSANLDMNSNDIINVDTIYVTAIDIDGVNLTTLADEVAADAAAASASAIAADASADAAAASASSAAASLSAVEAVEDSLPTWRGPWLTATAYALGDLVQEAGSSYICILAHTSGVFATDLAAAKWELFAQKGAAGAGTGDMLAANNLSDVANAATARGNLGLGSIATQASSSVTITGGSITGITDLAVADGGTGASTAADARTNLGLGTLAVQNEVDITDFAAATLVTAADTIASNDNDSTVPTSAAVIDYVTANAAVDCFYEAITASTTWNRPTGFDDDAMVFVQLWGAGGSGGRGGQASGGGGGGGYKEYRARYADITSTVAVTIGAGGTAKVSNGDGNAGGNTTFGAYATAYGGAGGSSTSSASTTVSGGGGGGELAAGSGSNGGAIGGGDGNAGSLETSNAITIWGGGGGGRGSDSTGNTGGNAVYGGGGGGSGGDDNYAGGSSVYGGAGGFGRDQGGSTSGIDGTAPGGGGGGSEDQISGAGARGEVRIWITG